MVSDWGHRCEESGMMYKLEVERERDGVRVRTQMRRKWDNVQKLKVVLGSSWPLARLVWFVSLF